MLGIIGAVFLIAGAYRAVVDPGTNRITQNWEWLVDLSLIVVGLVILGINMVMKALRVRAGMDPDDEF